MRRYPAGGAFALFFHPHPREFATQNKKSANARGLAGGGWAQLELTDALQHYVNYHCTGSGFLRAFRYQHKICKNLNKTSIVVDVVFREPKKVQLTTIF